MTTETQERTYHTIDKSGWSRGPWDDEPDKVSYRDDATGLPCLIKRNPEGVLCGYVGVANGHPAYGQRYEMVDVDVHGGLTYSDHCQDGPEDTAICHIPAPGEPDDVWWLGYDCGHSFDYCPNAGGSRFMALGFFSEFLQGVDALFAELPPGVTEGEYRDITYVAAGVTGSTGVTGATTTAAGTLAGLADLMPATEIVTAAPMPTPSSSAVKRSGPVATLEAFPVTPTPVNVIAHVAPSAHSHVAAPHQNRHASRRYVVVTKHVMRPTRRRQSAPRLVTPSHSTRSHTSRIRKVSPGIKVMPATEGGA
jgi:hypothetical protein